MLKKLTIIIILFFTVLISSPVFAATDNTSNIPETNPFCWHLEDCQKFRKQYGGSGTGEEGFVSNASVAPCQGGEGPLKWGRCLPAGTTKTEISFGGKSEFTNIGDFIVLMYKYMLTIASIVAAVMILIAGVQWITSGGNSEAIGSAKKRIAGALIGLFIGYMSYFVLNSINPALVNLRLPQVWMVKPISLTPEFCSQLEKPGEEGKIKFMHAAGATEQAKPVTPETAGGKADGFKWKLTDKDIFHCGERFFVEAGGKTPCMGDICPGVNQTCFDKVGKRENYICGNVRIGGLINYIKLSPGDIGAKIAGEFSSRPVKNDHVWLDYVCNEQKDHNTSITSDVGGDSSLLKGVEIEGKSYYIESTLQELEDSASATGSCENLGGFKGFVLRLELEYPYGSNEFHFFGRNGVDLGYDTKIYVGSAYYFTSHGHKVDPKYMFSIEDFKKGIIRQSIDINSVRVVYKDSDPAYEYYKQYWEEKYK
ncbi:MAG: Uncharacterized protein G01um101413_755 [Parcubacteria group bacterium Gr01-1014_13]|nr:MAG: Uncharacterized protein G01um101413_755 [Parcubacteria group bacterium Gr01-1014_13]